jgi:predicted ribosome quality control (RQC) complex YloA/Tae2 family protein
MKEINIGNHKCFVGGNSKENWALLDKAKPDDLFFHLSKLPSCYVILQQNGNLDPSILYECAKICLNNTKYKNMKGVYVDCTEIRNVRKSEDIGSIEYKNNKKINKIRV